MEWLDYVTENWDKILMVLGTLYTLASMYVRATPDPKDDELLRRIVAFLSFFNPSKDKDGVPKQGKPLLKAPFSSPK